MGSTRFESSNHPIDLLAQTSKLTQLTVLLIFNLILLIGITTGISSTERALTMNLLATESSTSVDFVRPGHIFPLRAKPNGTLARDGHTEAAVDLSRLAGRHPSGVLCEIVSEENPTEMARLPELKRFCKHHGFVLTSIVDIAQYRRDTENVSQ